MKLWIIACVSIVGCTGGFASTIYFPGLPYVTAELHAPPIATTLTAALYILFLGIAPVIWAAISEYFYIRRFLFLVAMFIFTVTSIGAAFVNNIWALIVVRCIQSVGVSSGQSLGAGYIADLYPIEERGAAFGKYMFGVIFGPLLGPIIGGFLIMSNLSWRATFWFCFAFGFFILIITFLFTPETYRDNAKFDVELPIATNERISLSSDQNSKCDDESNVSTIDEKDNSSQQSIATVMNDKNQIDKKEYQKTVIKENQQFPKKRFNPFAAFALLRHPFIFMSSITAGIFFGAMFATESILPTAFSKTYGLVSWQTGLCYLGAGIGNLSGALVGGRLSDRLLLRSRRLRGGIPRTEDRLTVNIWIAGFIFNPLGLLLFGWVVEHHLNIWIAIVAFGIQCFGNVQVVTTVTAYLVDSVPGRGATVTAAVNFVRFGIACILTIISTPMIAGLGTGWTATLFACLSWFGMLLMLILKIWGESIRRFSGY
ncbi:major facilitator superfamily domain-containing protein [Cokeromyces recurvatus]|uniref:major facilitator superfamily domain-containing protein n=1 Tax=Cokeromyces recurvatus TaxID=90255 RepID=UPI00221F3448|nr:major facilitator superfamily domain-containing protein [Cokeromyces recurvatus]KAI7908346.1 major facilitator superfamily domain-containing protein [Cokeromyces recurvatus]